MAGAANILTGTGNAGALEQLGYSVDGVTINLNLRTEDVQCDIYGPLVPFDIQRFLVDANVTCQLVYWDDVVLNKNRRTTTAGVPGVMEDAGILVGFGGNAFRLVIRSTPTGTGLTNVEGCWNFPNSVLVNTDSFNLGTRRSIHTIEWRCFPTLAQTGTSSGATLWTTDCS